MKRRYGSIVLSAAMLANPVGADWTASVGDAIDGVREYGGRILDATRDYGGTAIDASRRWRESWFDAPPEPLTEAEIEAQQAERLRRIWGKTLKRLDEVRQLDARIERAPESRWIGEDRRSLRAERRDVFETLARLLEDPYIVRHRDRIDALRRRIDVLRAEIAEWREQRVMAVADERRSIDSEIDRLEGEIASHRKHIAIERGNLQKRFRRAGLTLSDAQLTALLARVDADDLIGMAVMFRSLSAITDQLMAVMRESGEDLRQARRYYGMYVALLEFVLHMQDAYLDKLSQDYLPRIDRVLADTRRVQKASLQLLMGERSEARKAIVRKNIEAQRLTLEVARLYRRQLLDQRDRVERARAVVLKDYRVARNTYETVRIGADLVRLMQVSQAAFAAVMDIQIPNIAPFESLEMQRKFEELSRLLDERS